MSVRVLQVGKFFPPDSGGIETITKDLVSTTGEGYFSDALCFSSSNKTKIEYIGQAKIIRAGTLTVVASMPVSLSYFTHFRKLRKSYDIIHLHHPNPLGFICLLLLSSKAKLVIHWHSDILNKGLFYKLFAPIERALLKKADAIVATSPIYIEGSPVLQKFREKCSYIPCSISENSLTADRASVNAIKEKYKNKKIVFALGRHVGYKGFHYLIKAATYLPGDVVVLIGGTGPLYGFHQKLIQELSLAEKVFLVGRVPNADLGNYYDACDVFCLPSCHKSEAFGIVLIEAMRFKKPVVATNIPGSGVSWVNLNGITGLNAENENPESIAKAITALLADDTLRLRLGENACNRYKEFFTAEKMRECFDKLYKGLLA